MRARSLALVLFTGMLFAVGCGGESINVGDIGRTVETGAVLAGEDPEEAKKYGKAAGALTGVVSGIDLEAERELGSGIAVQAFSEVGPLHPSDDMQRYVNLVGRAVARQSSRPKIPYSFAVLENDAPNAFAAPGGYIFITTGALKLMQDEAELAGVLGHEIAHVSEQHMLQTYKRNRVFEAALSTAEALGEDTQEYSNMVDFGTDVLLERGLDKRFELEADVVGTEYAALTGYDPEGFANFLQHLMAASDKQGGWFSTHPSFSERLSRLQSLMPELRNAQSVTNRERFERFVTDNL